jgi:SAM-dependent methyltransferase
MGTVTEDGSSGYEAVANIYIAGRGTRSRVGDSIGAAVVKAWAAAFPPGATVLDLGSGPGEPSTRILKEAGLTTYAVDASPTMVAAFRERFPGVPIERNTVEASEFFNRTFRGVLAWGLLFYSTRQRKRSSSRRWRARSSHRGAFSSLHLGSPWNGWTP